MHNYSYKTILLSATMHKQLKKKTTSVTATIQKYTYKTILISATVQKQLEKNVNNNNNAQIQLRKNTFSNSAKIARKQC